MVFFLLLLFSPAAVMQKKEEFSFLLFIYLFLADPGHVITEEKKPRKHEMLENADNFSLPRSSVLWVRRGKWNSGCWANINIIHKWVVNFPIKKVTRNLHEMFEWHGIIQELLAIECGIYDSVISCTVQKHSTI